MSSKPQRITFPGAHGADLAARLDLPPGQIAAFAIFAHCFACSKETLAASRISAALTSYGIAVLRFDFTGLGGSGGDFGNTGFSSNVEDLKAAAAYLADHFKAPSLLVGHSLGGAAVLAAAGELASVKAVVTLGAPADPAHALHHFGEGVEKVKQDGVAAITIAGRTHNIRKSFIEDMESQSVEQRVAKMHKPLLVMHAPLDTVVGVENANRIFIAAKHPKSFVSLDDADHMLTDRNHAKYAARVIAAWADRYLQINRDGDAEVTDVNTAISSETGEGKFQQVVRIRRHGLFADEPTNLGGLDSGPTPFQLLAAALSSCTSMTIRMYADHKGFPLEHVETKVQYQGKHMHACEGCAKGEEMRIDHFERSIKLEGESLTEEMRQKMLEIADRCPVHLTMEKGSKISTKLEG